MKIEEASALYFERAAHALGLDPAVRKQLLTPMREVKVECTLTLDSGDGRNDDLGTLGLNRPSSFVVLRYLLPIELQQTRLKKTTNASIPRCPP